MGMTIEEHKEHLLDIMDSMPDDACGDWRDSLAYAIETLNKYQKIEQIVNEYNLQLWDNTSDGGYNFQRIREVLKDGK